MLRILATVGWLSLVGAAAAADGKYTVAVEATPPPKELAEPIRKLLDDRGLTVKDASGKVLCTVWPRKALEAKQGATGAPVYTSLEETTVMGAIRFPDVWSDFRKYKIKPGVYTLRLGIQPMDGDHMGTAPYNEFCLLAPADRDKSADLLDPMDLHHLSFKATGRKHPGIVLLYPNLKPAEAPAAEAKPMETWVLSYRAPITVGGKAAVLGVSLVVVGHTTAE
jgi:hypothetical protein